MPKPGVSPVRTYTLPPLPPRPADGHKGTFGRVLIVSGSPTMLGAPVFAGTAALRAGAGLVQIATHKSLLPHALSITPELIGHALRKKDDDALLAEAQKADVLAIGPGMGVSPTSSRRLIALLKLNKPTLLDADALTLLAQLPTAKAIALTANHPALILTPHPGEMQRLRILFNATPHSSLKDKPLPMPTSDKDRLALATLAATTLHATVILKGARTVVTDGTTYFINPITDSSLAKAGTGDILSGLTATLLHQCATPFAAAQLAVHLHAMAGVLAGKDKGPRSTLARDILDHLPQAIQSHPAQT